MIDPNDDSLGFQFARYCQSHERVKALLAFLNERLSAEHHDVFLALVGGPAKQEAEASLLAAARQVRELGLDPSAIVASVVVDF